ncbi:uncharacterized protein [Setaria viridis]|uniref:uncharacterized protein n=1 Tax=Setaria viridis TaxID=4556 RepID=UPI001493C40C|nr:uncharacterized protein LOC117834704 [Setaria viridis]
MKESSCRSPLMAAYCQDVCKLEDKFRGIELHHVPQKDNDVANFLTKLAPRWGPSSNGVFVNDLHEPSARVREDPTQSQSDCVLRGSDPDAPMATSPRSTDVMVHDPTNWRASLLAYILEEVLPLERIEAR